MKVELEKLENHKGVVVRVLLDSRAIGLFIDITFARKKEFKIEKLKKPLLVRNVDRTANAGGCYQEVVNASVITLDRCSRRT